MSTMIRLLMNKNKQSNEKENCFVANVKSCAPVMLTELLTFTFQIKQLVCELAFNRPHTVKWEQCIKSEIGFYILGVRTTYPAVFV